MISLPAISIRHHNHSICIRIYARVPYAHLYKDISHIIYLYIFYIIYIVHTNLYDRQIHISKYKNLHTGCIRFAAIIFIIKYSNE